MAKNIITKNVTFRKDFSYSNKEKNVNLSFSIRIDNSSELKGFRTLLEQAIVDIDEELKGMKN